MAEAGFVQSEIDVVTKAASDVISLDTGVTVIRGLYSDAIIY